MRESRFAVNASGGKVGSTKDWSGIWAARACDGATGVVDSKEEVFWERYGDAIVLFVIFVCSMIIVGFLMCQLRLWFLLFVLVGLYWVLSG